MGTGSRLRVPADQKQLSVIRDFVEEQAKLVASVRSDIDDLIQAVDEAATNIIVHGYKQSPGTVEVEIRAKPGRMIVILRDTAPYFDPTQFPAPDIHKPLEERPIGGLGIHLIRQFVDKFSHTARKKGGNELTLIKYLKK